MFVHVGGEVVVDAREVVAILDARRLQRTAEARALLARALLARAAQSGREPPRAIVVTTRGVHATAMGVATVARRIAALHRSPTARNG
ncbi:MAG: hypothetical protein QN178_06020 [Armatimonadota bacterium]|nr:hypothetical protein [Armatimonadota bacterium]